jgi:glycosyltransferase involved in cell wall biosynthesis
MIRSHFCSALNPPVPLRVLLVSSVPPRLTNGGELLLNRHLLHDSRIEVGLITEHRWIGVESAAVASPNRILRRLRPTSFQETVRSLLIRWEKLFPMPRLVRFAKHFDPDLVLTVAHGWLFPYAALLAKRLHRPLVSIFHDWWPALIPAAERRGEEQRFRRLYSKSKLVLSVSREMLDLLGPHRDARVLLPIPGAETKAASPVKRNRTFNVLYAGRLNHPYQAAMRELTECLVGQDLLKLTLLGDASEWPLSVLEELGRAGIYQGEYPAGDRRIETAIERADALLAHLSFSPDDALRVRTSFPSKLTDYFRRGKPIILWAPHYSAASQWARSYDAVLVVDDPSPAALVRTLEQVANDEVMRKELGARATQLATGPLSAENIQNEFIAGLVAASGGAKNHCRLGQD